MAMSLLLLSLSSTLQHANAANLTLGPSAFTAPGAFPTSVYSSYYNDPTQTSAQVQPVISDPVSVRFSPPLDSVLIEAMTECGLPTEPDKSGFDTWRTSKLSSLAFCLC